MDEGRIRLDTPIRDDLDRPLPTYGPDPVFPDKYGPFKDLAGDPRWERITPRMCLTHSTGFNNFWFIEPDQKLRIHFEPGSRFSYSGEGFSLLQFAALVRGDGLSRSSRAELDRPQLAIATAHQFPCFGPDAAEATRREDLSAGLGVVVFDGPQGHGF